jgi:tRNA threonylcarbamoyladenosine biosynthesis protein TsaE
MPTAISQEKIDLSSENRTKDLANKILKKLKHGDIIFLYGEMGVGKTTFIKYLINAFQKKNNLKLTEITSPTFNLLNEYDINQIRINHYDLFRLKSAEEVKNLNLFESYSRAITLIEWPQIIKEKPKNLIELRFNYEDDHKKRSVQVKGLDL